MLVPECFWEFRGIGKNVYPSTVLSSQEGNEIDFLENTFPLETYRRYIRQFVNIKLTQLSINIISTSAT